MPQRTIKLLHIEDDLIQQRMMAHHLASLADFKFAITTADSEDGAVAEFERLQPELVILDYHLSQGNGLSCLRKLRQQDRIVPIVAVSGKATPEIAAELLRVGADDYLNKQELTAEIMAGSVRAALLRADTWRRWVPAELVASAPTDVAKRFTELCHWFAQHNGPELLQRLDDFEAAARQAQLTEEQVESMFQTAGAEASRTGSPGVGPGQPGLRPLFLEVLLRLFGDGTTAQPGQPQ
jgi:DNA-binding response OmpR family regulator